ncbi:DgyrCDS4304 [Dimorphilus gyrociliatus]|uniref:DgyrCDS4304 n=1 Tax=Dimorphilus gyrociliatus TaxID=2664684 RepID=A0A7I8VI06_9ANNE|nr:DgyrCDS4304 [Dimorphilus gyrociliatus]
MDLTNEWNGITEEIRLLKISPRSIPALANLPKNSKFKFRKISIYSFLIVILAFLIFHGSSYVKDVIELNETCFIQVPESISLAFRPAMDCNLCKNVRKVHRVSKISVEKFEKYYAYSQQPVIITDAMKNWSASAAFNFEYFKKLFGNEEVHSGDMCQFFPYKTHFKSLGEAMNMSSSYMKNTKWYIGWSNCDPFATTELRNHYSKPYFLPRFSESSRTDWIFMGSPGYGASMHIDRVGKPSWQAQVKGQKLWTLEPAPECYLSCKNRIQVTVNPGEIIVLDTNYWFHSTRIIGSSNSITIGSEYD